MAPIRIKICGITRPEDGVAAAKLGVDAIGLIFHEPSARAVDTDRARTIKAALPPFVTVVGLFVNADPTTVMAIIDAVSPHLLQFHGDEGPGYCEVFGLPFIKAVPMGGDATVTAYEDRFPTASALLLDSHGGAETGGTGKRFDWSRIPQAQARRKPIILAGGLNPDNVARAVTEVRPYAVDVSSGVESAKGIKDPTLMAAFVQGVKRGEASARD